VQRALSTEANALGAILSSIRAKSRPIRCLPGAASVRRKDRSAPANQWDFSCLIAKRLNHPRPRLHLRSGPMPPASKLGRNAAARVAIGVAEAAGIVLYVYLVGGAVMVIRLNAGGLPSGSDLLGQLSGGQILEVGTRAILGWVAITVPASALLWTRLGELLDRLLFVVHTWRKLRPRRYWVAAVVSLLIVLAASVAVVVATPSKRSPGLRDTHYAVGVAIGAATLILLVAVRNRGRRQRLPPAVIVLLIAVLSAALALAAAADQRTKLSEVVFRTTSHRCLAAALIASNDRGLYLADGVHHLIVLVPNERIVAQAVLQRKVYADASVITLSACPSVTRFLDSTEVD
jgi:hypothetical protein